MDAIEFVKESHRLCDKTDNCDVCPVRHGCPFTSDDTHTMTVEQTVAAVEKWSREHPREHYPTWAQFLRRIYAASPDNTMTFYDWMNREIPENFAVNHNIPSIGDFLV